MFGFRLVYVPLVLIVGFLLVLFFDEPAAAAVPDGFEDKRVASVGGATAMAFTPDGRMLVTTKDGRLKVLEEGNPLEGAALDISGKVCSNSERGLLGVAVDPNFGTNGYVYLYYTFNKHDACPVQKPFRTDNPVNRVSRFVMTGDTIDPATEEVLVDNVPSPNGNHNAGDLNFGKDGKLYISTGDGACDYESPANCQSNNDASRDRDILLGKILRIEPDGSIPADNPYTGPNSGRCNETGRTSATNCRETFAMGLRNPFRMAFDPDTAGTSFRINDVGGGSWEEIDSGKSGADYAWNICEGRHDNPFSAGSVNCTADPYTPPLHEYNHDRTGCSSITGAAFVPDGVWPASYDKAYLFGDYVCGKIFKLTRKDGGGFERTTFANKLAGGGPVHMAFGPYRGGQALYYTTFAGGGEVHAIVNAGDYPTASVKGVPNNWSENLTIELDGSGSTDPQGDLSEYVWDFGDGTPPETTATPTNDHTYAESGKYEIKLTVRDAQGLEDTATLSVFPGNTPPEPEIGTPSADALFRVGQKFTLRGSATDAQDGSVPDSALSWEVLRHHDGSHTHPYFSGDGDGLSFTAPAPEALLSTNPNGNYLEIRLTATDSLGLSKTVTQRLEPKAVRVRFATRPLGLKLKLNGRVFRAPNTFLSWQGYRLNVYAPPQRYDGRRWVFHSWSDGRAAAHTIRTPAEPTRYLARFKPARR